MPAFDSTRSSPGAAGSTTASKTSPERAPSSTSGASSGTVLAQPSSIFCHAAAGSCDLRQAAPRARTTPRATDARTRTCYDRFSPRRTTATTARGATHHDPRAHATIAIRDRPGRRAATLSVSLRHAPTTASRWCSRARRASGRAIARAASTSTSSPASSPPRSATAIPRWSTPSARRRARSATPRRST